MVAAVDDAERTLVVEVADEGVGGKGRLVPLGGIEWKVAHQHVGEQWIADSVVDDLIDRSCQKLFAHHIVGLCMAERVERRGPRHLLHQRIIAVEGVALRGEVLGQSLDKRLAAVAHHEVMAFETDDVIPLGIELRQFHAVLNLKIA